MKNVLVLYNGQSMYTQTVRDYVEAFGRYSRHNVHYLHIGVNTILGFDLNAYDVLLITYSCRLCYPQNWSHHVWKKIVSFSGLKAAFIQDEYQETDNIKKTIRELGITLVFTCVPTDKIDWVYPKTSLPETRFVKVLTGYVTERLRIVSRLPSPSLKERPLWVGYRGRALGHCWGDLAFFKVEIGKRMKEACKKWDMPHDIEWTEDKRIYQDHWYSFISTCRVSLGTPSGSNIFDWDGQLERKYRALIQRKPNLLYEEYRPKIADKEAEIDMGQISPRIFECIALGSALILLEGSYSDILRPYEDYIPVKRDFSNLSEVLSHIKDVHYLEALVKNTKERIIDNEDWSYKTFIRNVDSEIDGCFLPVDPILEASERIQKAYDQEYFEAFSLKFSVQFPMTRCLDLSHLRNKKKNNINNYRLINSD